MCNRFVDSFTQKVLNELETPNTYYLLYIDYNWRERGGGSPRIYARFICKRDQLPEELFKVLTVQTFDDNYIQLMKNLSHGCVPDIFSEIREIEEDEDVEDFFELMSPVVIKIFLEKGLTLLKEIHKNIGLLKTFDTFPYSNGNLCLIEDKNGLYEKLIRNGL